MKLGIISDTHDRCDYIDRFVRFFEDEGIEMILHLGDLVAPFAAKRFAGLAQRIPFRAIYGNNDGEREGLKKTIAPWGVIEDGPIRLEADGKVIVAHHYPMSAEEVRAIYPDADYYFSGHTHERVDVREGGLRLINPGEACAWLTGRATAGILDPAHDQWREVGWDS